MKKKPQPTVFDTKELYQDLLHSARATGLSESVAAIIATKVTNKVATKVTSRSAITTDDLNRFIAAETEKYSQDLAYIYKNRDKII